MEGLDRRVETPTPDGPAGVTIRPFATFLQGDPLVPPEVLVSRFAFPLLVVAVLAGCSSEGPTELREALGLGVIEFYQAPTIIDLPDTVDAGTPFPVRVRTYGGGCQREGPTETEAGSGGIIISPYDFDVVSAPRNFTCPDILRHFDHGATLSWPVAGEIRVVVRGLVKPGKVKTEVERQVVVR